MDLDLLKIIGIILIISSLVSCLLLLRKNVIKKQFINSSSHVLTISDALSNIFIAIILLISQSLSTNYFPEDILNSTKVQKVVDEREKSIPNLYNCDFQNILMDYGIFFIPFINNFISVISKSLDCNFDAESIKFKCDELIIKSCNFIKTEKINKEENDYTELKHSTPKLSPLKHRKFFTTISIISQWLIPIVSMFIMNITGYTSMNELRASHAPTCILATNFLFHNYDNYSNCNFYQLQEDNSVISDVFHDFNFFNNSIEYNVKNPILYLNSSDFIETNSSETDQIVTQIREIVQQLIDLNKSSEAVLHRSPRGEKINNKIRLNQLNYAEYLNNIKYNISNYSNDDDGDYNYQIDGFLTQMENYKCLISPNILKMYMIILLFIMYFGPILLSSILQIRVMYICSNIARQLIIVNSMKKGRNIDDDDDVYVKPGQSSTSDGNSIEIHENQLENIKRVINDIEKKFCISRKIIYSAILLWTPLMVEVLFKIFLCFSMPDWLTNIFFTLAMLFGIVRNALNLWTINCSKILPQDCVNVNRMEQKSSSTLVEQF